MHDKHDCIADMYNLPKETFRKIMRQVSEAKAVDYSAKNGAVCPVCGAVRCSITSTPPWAGAARERHHKCPACNHRFKSVEDAA